MAGQELKATDKVVLKMSKDGAVQRNLADDSVSRVSKRTADAILKQVRTPEQQLDKLKVAGLITSEHKKRVYTNLKFGRNNPDKPDTDGDNQQSEQTVSAFIPPLGIKFKAKSVDKKQFGTTALQQKRKQHIREENAVVKEHKEAFEAENTDIPQSNDISEQKFKKPSKLNDGKVRNTLQAHSSAAEKLTDDRTESGILNFEKDDVSVGDKLISDDKADKKLLKQVSKDEKKLAKADKKLQKAQDRLPTQRNIRIKKEFDPEKGKVQRKLCFEKEVKPIKSDGLVTKGVKGAKNAVSASVSGTIHNQFAKYEDENSALKAAHKTEKVAESALHTGKSALKTYYQNAKTKPYRTVSKLKFNSEKANQKLSYHKALLENKNLRDSGAVKQSLKKAQMKRNQVKNARETQRTAAKATEFVKKTAKKVQEALAKNYKLILGAAVILLIFGIFTSACSSLTMMMCDTGTSIIATSYTAEDDDIYAAEDYMKSLENNLNDYISNIPNYYVGWQEYRYHLDEIGHDPYGLISYLTAKNMCFEYNDALKNDIQTLFNALYTLKIVSIHEVRSYETIVTDAYGEDHTVIVYYDYYILDVTLTANDFDEAVKAQLEELGVYDLYELLQETKGNRPDLF